MLLLLLLLLLPLLLLLLIKRYNLCRVLAFSKIFFHSRRSWASSDHLVIFIFLPIYNVSFLSRLERISCLRFIPLLSFRRESLARKFYETRLLALCSTPVTLKDLRFSVGVVSLSWFVPINASGTRFSPLHGLAV